MTHARITKQITPGIISTTFANIHCAGKTLSCYRPEKKLNRTPTVKPEVKPIPEGEFEIDEGL